MKPETWYVTDYPSDGEFAVTDGSEILAVIWGGKTVGEQSDIATRIAKLPTIERELTAITEQRDGLIKASKSLLHYVKLARKGDSPLIHATIVEAVDLEIAKLEEALNQIPTTPTSCQKAN